MRVRRTKARRVSMPRQCSGTQGRPRGCGASGSSLQEARTSRSVADLQGEDFAAFEIGADRQRIPQRITSLRYVPPLSQAMQAAPASSLQVRLGSGCAEATTPHYRMTYPVSETEIRDGAHTLVVTSPRYGVKLSLAHTTSWREARSSQGTRLQHPEKRDCTCKRRAGFVPVKERSPYRSAGGWMPVIEFRRAVPFPLCCGHATAALLPLARQR